MSPRPLSTFTKLWMVMFMLGWSCAGSAQAPNTLFSATATVDFSGDTGQSFGTLFEVRNADGRPIIGAGFPDIYNTCVRTDRYGLQFYVRPEKPVEPHWELLPRSTEIAHTSIQDLDGHLYAYTYAHDKRLRRWDDSSGAWVDDDLLDPERHVFGDGFMRVAGKLLVFQDGQAWYDGARILGRPETGAYSNFYYAHGHLFFYHRGGTGESAFTNICACPWRPGQSEADVSAMKAVSPSMKSETTFVWGQLNHQVLTVSNWGTVAIFSDGKWRILREHVPGTSYQVYSMVNYRGDLYLGHYPTGRLLKYDGQQITELPNFPPVMPGVSDSAREAQTTMIYGGELYAGVWPWAELWRLDRDSGEWLLARRMFTQPELTDKVAHPWEQEIRDYNEATGAKMVINEWGHRICSMTPWRDSLMVATSAKGPSRRDPNLAFLTDDVYAEYGRVWRCTRPGHLSARVSWKPGPTVLQCVLLRDRLRVLQDGEIIGEALIDPALLEQLQPASIAWATGLYGDFGALLVDRVAWPPLRP
ncbi:MAG: hypothetical protein HPY44_09460 [Armatimonadetes bacterium]|nr:hypothetical protein [Armatimonadota bacterium]